MPLCHNRLLEVCNIQGLILLIMTLAIFGPGIQLNGAEITGSVQDRYQKNIPDADIILYHQDNHSTAVKTNPDGSFKIVTKRNGNVQLTVNRFGYCSKVRTILVPTESMSTVETGVITLEEKKTPQIGSEIIRTIIPPLSSGAKLEAFILPAKGASSFEWKLEIATLETMYSGTIEWVVIDHNFKEGPEGELYGFVLSDKICASHEHIKAKVSIKIRYPLNNDRDNDRIIEKHKIIMISRRSDLAVKKGTGQ